MPDITKCSGNHCDRKKECYRFTAEPNKYWQSYGIFEDHCMKFGYCYLKEIPKTTVPTVEEIAEFITNAVATTRQ